MRKNFLLIGLSIAFGASGAWGQQAASAPTVTHEDIYCSGMVTTTAVPHGTRIISGEQSNYKLSFSEGDYVYINKGSSQGVNVGDEYLAMRPYQDDTGIQWYTQEDSLLKGMGQPWADLGRIKVVNVQKDVSIAQVEETCSPMDRGDIVVPYADREVPQLKSEANFNRFAPPSGKSRAEVVIGKNFEIESGTGDIVFVNQGSAQGVKVGDYFRIFRYQGNDRSNVFQTPDMATQVEGYGAAPDHYTWKELPREVLGEGIVLRTSPNSSTVLITYSLREIFEGDYCELE